MMLSSECISPKLVSFGLKKRGGACTACPHENNLSPFTTNAKSFRIKEAGKEMCSNNRFATSV